VRVLRWCLREPRVWVTLAAVVVAIALAGRDGHAGWVRFVATSTFVLAGLSIRARYDAAHPDRVAEREAREAAKRQAEVDEILARHEERRGLR
jgi:hypothetical protein